MASDQTRIIIGLGNPGREYAATRHNMGFLVIDELARRTGIGGSRRRFRSEVADGRAPWGKIVLAKPQTYMNDSGLAVREIVQWYRQPLDAVLIVVDDLDLPFGQMRLRASGSPGGHNGLKSIARELGTDDVPRLRVGIGRDDRVARARVLSRFSPEEREQLSDIVRRVADVVEFWASRGIVEAMNIANVRPKTARTPEQAPERVPGGVSAETPASAGSGEPAKAGRGRSLIRLLDPTRRECTDG